MRPFDGSKQMDGKTLAASSVCVCAATLVVCSSPKAKIMDAIHYLRKVVASSRLIGGGSFWTKQCELWTLKPTKGD